MFPGYCFTLFKIINKKCLQHPKTPMSLPFLLMEPTLFSLALTTGLCPLLPSMVEAENISAHPRMYFDIRYRSEIKCSLTSVSKVYVTFIRIPRTCE